MQQENNTQQGAAAPPKENMKARTITAIGYVALLLGLISLRAFVPEDYGALGFDALFWAVSILGANEFMRAMKCVSRAQYWCAMVTCALIIPLYVGTKMICTALYEGNPDGNEPWLNSLLVLMSVSSLGAIVTAAMLVFDFEKSDLKSTTSALFCILYCGVLGSVSANINHMNSNAVVGVTLMFFITVAVDTFALLFGKLFGRAMPLKLAPHTSPNKTVIGFIGGIVGGILAAVIMWALGLWLPQFRLVYDGKYALLILVLISIPTAILAQIGDLFESAIKRGCGIKDMGKLLPGHGGVLDRFDSMLFASIAIIVCFIIIR